MPPSPICSSSLYGPMTVPGAFGGGLVDGRRRVAHGRAVQQAVGGVGGRQQGLDVSDQASGPRRTPPGRIPAGGPGRGCPGRRGRSPRRRARDAVMGASAAGQDEPVRNTMRETGAGPVTFFSTSRSGPVAGRAVDRHPEPAPGVRPVLLGGGGGDAEGGGGLLGGQAGEEPELDQLGLPRVLRLELPEGLVQGEQVGRRSPPPGPARCRRGRAGGVRRRPCGSACGGRARRGCGAWPRPRRRRSGRGRPSRGPCSSPTSRRYASWTRAVAWSVWPGCLLGQLLRRRACAARRRPAAAVARRRRGRRARWPTGCG